MRSVCGAGRVLAFLVVAMAAEVPEARAASAWQAWVADPLTRVQPTSPVGGSTAATLKAARNEYEAVQLVVRAPDAAGLSGVNVSVSDLVGPATIAKKNIALYRAQFIPVTSPTKNSPNPPGDWADALIPSTVPGGTYSSFPFSVPAGKNQPIVVEIYVPKTSPAGKFTGTITVVATGQSPIHVPVNLTVWNFTIPDKPTLASHGWGFDQWMSENAKYSAGSDRATLVKNLHEDYRRHRVGVGETSMTGPFPNAAIDAVLQKQTRMSATWNMTDAALQQLVTAYGADQLCSQHRDEPKTQSAIDDINSPNGETQRYRRSGVPELMTISHPIAWSANVDIYVPHHYMLTPELFDWSKGRNKVEDLLNAGKKVWSYTCCGADTANIPAWMLDFDLVHFRIPMWLDYSNGLTGFMYWTPVNWCPADPWMNGRSGNPSCSLGHNFNLEGVLYYPGHKVGAPNAAIPSARLKAIRDGVEDYEYLALLASLGDPAKAKALSRTLAPAWNDWNHDPAALLAVREQAAARIVQLSGGSGSGGEDGGAPDAGPNGGGTDAGLDASGGAGLDAGDSARAHVDANIDVGCALSRRRPAERGLWPVAGLALALALGLRRARGRRGDVDRD